MCRQPYDKQQCRHLLSAQQEDTDDTDAGEEDEEDSDENILFVPEPYDDFTPEEAQLQLQTDNFDSQYDDEDEGAWLQLQNVSTPSKLVISCLIRHNEYDPLLGHCALTDLVLI